MNYSGADGCLLIAVDEAYGMKILKHKLLHPKHTYTCLHHESTLYKLLLFQHFIISAKCPVELVMIGLQISKFPLWTGGNAMYYPSWNT